jgi:hypothetical protein
MTALKTQKNLSSVEDFISTLEPDRRADAEILVTLMNRATGEPAAMWGESIVGFGEYHYKYSSGHEGDWFLTGFSPRKKEFSLYLMCDLAREEKLLAKLGRHKIGKSCLYVRRLSDIDLEVLQDLIRRSVDFTRGAYS